MKDETQETGSQTVESQTEQEPAVADAFAAFGLDEQESSTVTEQEGDSVPAIEHESQPKTIKVKYNKEDVEIPEDQITEYVQRGLALEKERERKSEYERNLDRVAKLQGYKDHSELVANLDLIEQQQQERQKDQFADLRNQLVEEYEYAGGDPDNLTAWLDNNPLLNEAKEVLVREQVRAEQEKEAAKQEQVTAQWAALYDAYPHLLESAQAAQANGVTPDWFTTDMQARIGRGYDPVDAFELAHRSTLQQQTKKAAEQRAIKAQMLGRRSQVETASPADQEPSVPSNMMNAFSAFGLDPKAAKKYVKN